MAERDVATLPYQANPVSPFLGGCGGFESEGRLEQSKK